MQTNELHSTKAALASFFDAQQPQPSLCEIRRGIEREVVRTTPHGALSSQDHPAALGSALTHPFITTDFAEAQIELVTPALHDRSATFSSLATLHHFVADKLPANEFLWGASMPPALPADENIAIANYGSSNTGQLKRRYREGLANRYGKRMQLISGIHYNFSLPTAFWQALHRHTRSTKPLEAFISERYFHLIRNVLRHGWVVPYLFGASPAVDQSYVKNKKHFLKQWDNATYYLPWATSLRLSNMGYTSSEQSRFPVRFDSQEAYLSDLCHALTQPSECYTHLNAEQQLNSSVLQLENELYGSVRPKIVSDELRPLYAMCHHGVQYIELRSLDNNPYLPLGIDETQSHFLDVFLTYCALAPSPVLTDEERRIIVQRQELVATEGRRPGLTLPTVNGNAALTKLGKDLLDGMSIIADQFDLAMTTDIHQASINREYAKFEDSTLTPSAQILSDMAAGNLSFQALTQRQSLQHMRTHSQFSAEAAEIDKLHRLAAESLIKQADMETQLDIAFDDFVAQKNNLQCDCDTQGAIA